MGKKKLMDVRLAELNWVDADYIAQKFSAAYLHGVTQKVQFVGELRRQVQKVHGHIGIVCVPNEWGVTETGKEFTPIDEKRFTGVLKNGSRHKEFMYCLHDFSALRQKYEEPEQLFVKVELFITDRGDWGRILAMRTGDASFVKDVVASAWTRKGYVGTKIGLVKKEYCQKKGSQWVVLPEYELTAIAERPYFATEEDFFSFLNIKLVHPINRNKNEWPTRPKKTSRRSKGIGADEI
ncbi:MAG TPA: hypothetical protein PLJ00_16200 [Chitinophagales bacterium]|nr:hypothetical protein [Chitinophagales bacterium]